MKITIHMKLSFTILSMNLHDIGSKCIAFCSNIQCDGYSVPLLFECYFQ